MVTIDGVEYIRTDDSVESLVKAGVIPQWIADDALRHGMYIAEYILCEFDWEWGWDLGDGYSNEQRVILKDVRKRIQQGIRNYNGNKDLLAQDRERERLRKEREERTADLRKMYCNQYIDQANFKWMLDYEEKYESLPIIHFICFKSLLPTRSDLQKAILKRIGATCDDPMATEGIHKLFPELSERSVKSLAYHNWPLYKNYKTLVEEAVAALPSPIPDEDDPYWTEMIERQRLDEFGMTVARLRRLMTFFSLNKKTQAQKREGSLGVY